MRSALVILGTAAVVVAVYVFLGLGPDPAERSLTQEFDADKEPIARGKASEPPSAPDLLSRLTGTRVTAAPDTAGPEVPAGPLVQSIQRLRDVTLGRDPKFLDRAAFTKEIWLIEQHMKPEDIPLLVEAWEETNDLGFRWAMSWLFQRIPDDRLIEPLSQLIDKDGWRATDAIACIGTPAAIQRLTDIARRVDDPNVRSQAYIRISKSTWPHRASYLEGIWQATSLTAAERCVALETLAHVGDPEAGRKAMDVALGRPQPLGDLGERKIDHTERDLRSPAILSVMLGGHQDLARRLIERADAGDDPILGGMVDRHLGAYQGANISSFVFDRIERRGRVSFGEAVYLNRVATKDDLEALKHAVTRAESSGKTSKEVLDLLRATLDTAARRG